MSLRSPGEGEQDHLAPWQPCSPQGMRARCQGVWWIIPFAPVFLSTPMAALHAKLSSRGRLCDHCQHLSLRVEGRT